MVKTLYGVDLTGPQDLKTPVLPSTDSYRNQMLRQKIDSYAPSIFTGLPALTLLETIVPIKSVEQIINGYRLTITREMFDAQYYRMAQHEGAMAEVRENVRNSTGYFLACRSGDGMAMEYQNLTGLKLSDSPDWYSSSYMYEDLTYASVTELYEPILSVVDGVIIDVISPLDVFNEVASKFNLGEQATDIVEISAYHRVSDDLDTLA